MHFPFDPVNYLPENQKPVLYKSFGLKKKQKQTKNVSSDGFSYLNKLGVFRLMA